MRRFLRCLLAMAVLPVALVVAPTPAEADNHSYGLHCDEFPTHDGPPAPNTPNSMRGPCNADNDYHTAHRDLGCCTIKNAVNATLTQSWGTIPGITTAYIATAHGNTDVYYEKRHSLAPHRAATGQNVAGIYWCVTGNTDPDECDHAHVNLDREHLIAQNTTTEGYIELACHETGHTFGQLHPEDRGLPNSSTYRCMTPLPFDRWVGPHNASDVESNPHY